MNVPPKLPLIGSRLPRGFYQQSTPVVAAELIGKALLHRTSNGDWVGGWIVETEAYLGENDAASHSARGLTRSNRSMFSAPGTLYVYPIHARHCLNAVTECEGTGAAVLIRAIEPVWGIGEMKKRRGYEDIRRLTRGPAMLCQALSIDREDDGRCLIGDPRLGIFHGPDARRIAKSPRIGISQARDLLLRYVDADSAFRSRK
ncbi:MAG: DNA-3-methyladenine glycosylase [Planctomycetota bacterium]